MIRPRLVLALTCLAYLHAPARALAFPSDSGVVNVRAFGARGDGVHDDTDALLAAIKAAQVHSKFFWPTRIVYLPAGRYLVHDTLRSRDDEGHYQAQLALIGAGPTKTTIVLADRAVGYADIQSPKAVIFTSSGLRGGSPTAGGKHYKELGEGNDAYANYVESLSVDVGHGNPGATAIDYMANNIGAIRDVALFAPAGSGAIGIAMERRWPGPLLISDVTVTGFRAGISVKHPEYGVTLQHVFLRGQSQVSLHNSGNVVTLRDVHLETAAVGLINDDPRGMVVADDLHFHPTSERAVFAQNIGYLVSGPSDRARQAELGQFAAGGSYVGDTISSQFTPDWHLPEPPRAPTPALPMNRWVNVATFGAQPCADQDASTAIQAALDSGAAVVYFPTGRYAIDKPLHVPASVQRIEGMMSVLTVGRRATSFSTEQGMLRVTTGGKPLLIDKLTLDNMDKGPQVGFDLSGPRTVMLRDFISGGVGVMRRASGGPLLLENTVGPLNLSGPAGVWASQLNIEGQGTLIRNHGTPLSILGIKTEQNATVLENTEGGQAEIIGGLLYMVSPAQAVKPALTNTGRGRVFAAYGESAYRADAVYAEHMVQLGPEQHDVVVKAGDLPARGLGRLTPGRTLNGAQP